jgi:UDP-glucose 4-epimerase
MKILVAGGAGYIGSHMVKLLLDSDCDVVTFDNLCNGHADAVLGCEFVEGDVADSNLLDKVFATHQFDGVMHFASFIQVGESVRKPDIYYENNLSNTINLLNAMCRHDVKHLVFSSTAAIFGEPIRVPIDETHPKSPLNPYGRSKWMVEQLLKDYDLAYGLKSVCLRYFNAAGAHPSGLLGERHEPETHLIPLLLQVASGKRPHIEIFGRDYDTPDGTAIRDYIHIVDLCEAHLLAIRKLTSGGTSAQYNLGNGNGFSVLEVVNAIEHVTGKKLTIKDAPRRAGDPARLVADATLARQELNWQPQYASLETIIEHAWQWEKKSA